MNAETFILRNLEPERDLPALVTLWQAVEAADHSGTLVNEETLRARLALPGHDPRRERWVVQHPQQADALIGYCLLWLPPEAPEAVAEINLLVHPDWRAGGLPELLWQQVLAQAHSKGARGLHLNAARRAPGMADFWQQRGFTLEGGYSLLRRTLSEPLPAPLWPEGFRLQAYADRPDLALATRAMNEAYAGLWGHNEVSAEQMAAWLPDFDLSGFFLLFAPDGALAGISRVEINAAASRQNGRSSGYIDAPGLLPAYRRRDYYQALLRQVAGWLYSQGAEWIELESWGDAPETLELYAADGFEWISAVAGYRCLLAHSP